MDRGSFLLFRGESEKYKTSNLCTFDRGPIEYTKDQEIDYTEQVFRSIFHGANPFKSDLNWQFLAFMQHYEFKTRLLDYTSDEKIGLWYAVKENDEKAGFLHVACGINIRNFADDLDNADIESTLYNQDFMSSENFGVLSKRPCLFYRDQNKYNLRAVRHKAWFLAQPKYSKNCKEYVYTYKIEPDHKRAIKKELDANFGNWQTKALHHLSKNGEISFSNYLMANPDHIKKEFDVKRWEPVKFYVKTLDQVLDFYAKIAAKLDIKGTENDEEFFEKIKGLSELSRVTMMDLNNNIRLHLQFNEMAYPNSDKETFRLMVQHLANEVL